MIKKRSDGKYDVVHCHGKNKGKPINKKPLSEAKAISMHEAIEASKHRRGKK